MGYIGFGGDSFITIDENQFGAYELDVINQLGSKIDQITERLRTSQCCAANDNSIDRNDDINNLCSKISEWARVHMIGGVNAIEQTQPTFDDNVRDRVNAITAKFERLVDIANDDPLNCRSPNPHIQSICSVFSEFDNFVSPIDFPDSYGQDVAENLKNMQQSLNNIVNKAKSNRCCKGSPSDNNEVEKVCAFFGFSSQSLQNLAETIETIDIDSNYQVDNEGKLLSQIESGISLIIRHAQENPCCQGTAANGFSSDPQVLI